MGAAKLYDRAESSLSRSLQPFWLRSNCPDFLFEMH